MAMTASSSACPCFGISAETKCSLKVRKSSAYKNHVGMKKLKSMNSNLTSSFLDDEWYARMICLSFRNRQQQKNRKPIVSELGGQYEEVFNDVKLELRNCITKKAVRTVLYQLYEMNPPQYIWLHKQAKPPYITHFSAAFSSFNRVLYDFLFLICSFIAENDPADGKVFLRNLAKEFQDLAERVMITRLHLYGKWIKQCDHAEIYKEISDENLELMRERLMETIVWPTDENNTE